jgi:hypothetical protein
MQSTHKPRPVFPIPDGEDLLPNIPYAGDLFRLDVPVASGQQEAAALNYRKQEDDKVCLFYQSRGVCTVLCFSFEGLKGRYT